jgi:hypothetical protein
VPRRSGAGSLGLRAALPRFDPAATSRTSPSASMWQRGYVRLATHCSLLAALPLIVRLSSQRRIRQSAAFVLSVRQACTAILA